MMLRCAGLRHVKKIDADIQHQIMKLILAAVILAALFANSKSEYDKNGRCQRFRFRNGDLFKQADKLKYRITGLRELVYSRVHGAIFFKYNYYAEDNTNSRRKNKIGYIVWSENLFHPLNIRNVHAIAADNKNGIVYIGTKDGIYTLDRDYRITKTDVRQYVTSISVAKNGVYYVTHTHNVYIFTGRSEIELNLLEIAKIRHIAVNNRRKIVGVSKNGDVMTLTSNGLKQPKLKATNVVVGVDDEIYAYSRHGLYELSDSDRFYEVMNLRNLQGIAFVSRDEIYTASGGYIYMLTRSYDNDCYFEHRKN